MKKLLILIVMVCLGCTHYSEVKHESGVVVEKQYFPDTQQTVSGSGMTSDGKMVFTTHQIGESEKYIVIFKCDHGVVFSINRNDVYAQVDKGDEVTISYREILFDKDNSLCDLEFVNAFKK
jgi:hypothetical protein